MNKILNHQNEKFVRKVLKDTVDTIIDFKLQDEVIKYKPDIANLNDIIEDIPLEGKSIEDVNEEFKHNILKHCTNFSSSNFMGFPDSGNSVGAMIGSIYSELLQQNLINQSFCGPSATFSEIAVINWLRNVVGYHTTKGIRSVDDVGGIITPGGTSSNSIAMLLARENHRKNTMVDGVKYPHRYKVIVPKGIGHYSIKSSLMWIGCGENVIEVPTNNFKIDLEELKKVLIKENGNIMAVVLYAGDSRTMTIDNLNDVYDIVKSIDDRVWLHVDACHGFSLGFSEKLRHKIKGIELFDSISTDPHKVLCCPYVVSAILIKEPEKIKLISSVSDLITKEDFALGQTSPFIGSKHWMSLKLWYLIKNLGKNGIAEIIEKRCELAQYFSQKLTESGKFIILNDLGINSVMFMYGNEYMELEDLNGLNDKIYDKLLFDGKYHVHHFPIHDNKGVISKDKIVKPLRYMCGNPNTSRETIDEFVIYLVKICKEIESEVMVICNA